MKPVARAGRALDEGRFGGYACDERVTRLDVKTPRGPADEEQLRRLNEVAKMLVSELDLEEVLDRVLELARDLTGARYAALGILDEGKSALERFLTVGIDAETRKAIGPLPRGRGILGELIRNPQPLRIEKISADARSYGLHPNHPPMKTFLGVPILVRGEPYGNLYLTEKQAGGPFDERDEELVVMLSQWAAVAIANARSVASEGLRRSIEAAEQERKRWARELHDETLQELGGLKVLLEARMRGGEPLPPQVLERAVQRVDAAIDRLQEIIADLRPAALDELGLAAAIEALVERTNADARLRIATSFELEGSGTRLDASLESTIYRLAQEALRNVAKHAGASEVELTLRQGGAEVELYVRDDGCGFDPAQGTRGRGLLGMHERALLAGGSLSIESSSGAGTTLVATLPLRRPR